MIDWEQESRNEIGHREIEILVAGRKFMDISAARGL